MTLPRLCLWFLLPAFLPFLVSACGGVPDLAPTPVPTRVPQLAPTIQGLATVQATPTAAVEAPTPTEVPSGALQPLATATEPTPEDTPTPEPTATMVPAAAIEFEPQQLVLGGITIVYLNEPATAATMTFGGQQYPMLFDGVRWWAIAGVGAFAQTGLAPVIIAYNPADGSGQTAVEDSIPIVHRPFEIEYIELDSTTTALLDPTIVNNEEALRAQIFAGYTTQRLWDGPFQKPSRGPISSVYGVARSYNGAPVSSYHRGTDFAGSEGDPVYAAASGRVVFVDELKVRGNTVIIDHGVGVFTAYNHLSGFAVGVGETVTPGQLIGQMGATGLVTGPHLHWEVIVRGVEVDGELWLAP